MTIDMLPTDMENFLLLVESDREVSFTAHTTAPSAERLTSVRSTHNPGVMVVKTQRGELGMYLTSEPKWFTFPVTGLYMETILLNDRLWFELKLMEKGRDFMQLMTIADVQLVVRHGLAGLAAKKMGVTLT